MVEALGGLDGAASKFDLVNWPSTNAEWLEDSLTPLVGTLTVSTSLTVTDLTVADAAMFQPGQILLVDSEKMWVSAVTASGSHLTVTRGYASTTTATHATTADLIKIIGMARLEGATSEAIGFTDRTTGSNYTQIYHQEIKVSRTQNQMNQYGIAGEFDYQAAKAIPSLMRLVERNLFYGARAAGSASVARTSGGFSTFITDNMSAAATIGQTTLETPLYLSYQDGGTGPWIAPVSPTNMRRIKNILDSSNFVRVGLENTRLGMIVDRIMTPFGEASFLLDRWATDSEIWYVDPKNAGMLTFYPFTQEPLAKTGDFEYGEVVGEFTFLCKLDKSHAAGTNISA
jgi:hypothetical protein